MQAVRCRRLIRWVGNIGWNGLPVFFSLGSALWLWCRKVRVGPKCTVLHFTFLLKFAFFMDYLIV